FPWIADFRDPLHSPSGERAMFQASFGPGLERWILSRASIALANTDAMKSAWCELHPEQCSGMQVLWNGFDAEDTVDTYTLPARERKVLSHVGELYGGRRY